MSIHLGGRKIKTVYYGGKKIKEAYLGSTKVWSSAPPDWQENTVYKVGDLVLLGDAIYRATYTHRSSGGFRPGSGTYWSSAWEYVDSSGGVAPEPSPKRAGEWSPLTRYSIGDPAIFAGRLYTAKKENQATLPGIGIDSQYWE